MDFALFYEIPQPRPWTASSPHEAIKNAVDAAVLADRLGFHSYWLTEHHFLPELSISTSPELVFANIAAKTERIRLGHGVRLLPHPYNHPIRAAEMAATLDQLCDGRLEFGTGRSATRTELDGFQINPHETRAMQHESLEFIVRAWTEEEMEYEGQFFRMPQRNVVPKPYQQPHPPLWQATASPEGHVQAGEKGIGLLSFTVGVEPEVLAERIAAYRDGLSRAKPVGKFINDRVGVFTMVHCERDRKSAMETARESFVWYANISGQLVANFTQWLEELGTGLGSFNYGPYVMVKEAMDKARIAAETDAQQEGWEITLEGLDEKGAVLCGDPDRCIEVAKRYEAAGCQLLMCLVNPYKIPQDKLMESIELIGTRVLPEFAR
jgi:alkanesulfonate monooxygenase SsuD/methylene tetrahydromethanopterin reductase-like flavin-dependent oxidoreductase (luciferase family)